MSSRAVVVAEADDPVQAHLWVDALRQAGIEAATFEKSAGAAFGGAALHYLAVYPVVVRSGSLAAARSVIAEISGAGVLSPYRAPAERRTLGRLAIAALLLLGLLGLVVLVATRSLP